MVLNKFIVPPYRLVEEIMFCPECANVRIEAVIAAEPDANAIPATPPSKAANLCSRISVVGLCNLL